MNLSEIVRSGAQMMLQYALEREVTEALGRGYYENAPETTKEKGRRNGMNRIEFSPAKER